MVWGQLCLQGLLFRQLVAVALENGLDVFQPAQALPVGDTATGIQAWAGVGLVQVEQSKTDPVGLFWVFPFIQTITNPDQGVWPDVLSPVLEATRRPLLLLSVAGGHVSCLGGGTELVTARVTGNLPLLEVDLHQVACLDGFLINHAIKGRLGRQICNRLIGHFQFGFGLRQLAFQARQIRLGRKIATAQTLGSVQIRVQFAHPCLPATAFGAAAVVGEGE